MKKVFDTLKTPLIWRHVCVLLVLFNLLFWAWTQGHLRGLGLGPRQIAEPQRLQQQVQPEALQIRASASAAS